MDRDIYYKIIDRLHEIGEQINELDPEAIGEEISSLEEMIGSLESLSTTDKTDIVSAINEVFGMVEPIGTIVTGTNAESLEINASSNKTLSSLTLTTGKWIVIGGVGISASVDKLFVAVLKQGSNNIAGSHVNWSGFGTNGANTSAIVDVSGDTATVGLRVFNTDTSNRTFENVSLKAIKIGG